MTVEFNGWWLGTAVYLRLLISLLLYRCANQIGSHKTTVYLCKTCFQAEPLDVDRCLSCPARRPDAEEHVYLMTIWRPFYLHVRHGDASSREWQFKKEENERRKGSGTKS
jgi:hypothetical protein